MFDAWVGKILWKENGYPLQYSALENSMDYSIGSQRVRHDCNLAHYIINILEKAWLNVNIAYKIISPNTLLKQF